MNNLCDSWKVLLAFFALLVFAWLVQSNEKLLLCATGGVTTALGCLCGLAQKAIKKSE